MSPLSLLFSSDEETTRWLSRAFFELGIDTQHCPEIFNAVEQLTSRSFGIIVADFDEVPEAGFLLKTSRELHSSRSAFTVGVTSSKSRQDAIAADAHLLLSKPIIPEQVLHALFSCEEFLARRKMWWPDLVVSNEQPVGSLSASNQSLPEKRSSRLSSNPVNAWMMESSTVQTIFTAKLESAKPQRSKVGGLLLGSLIAALLFLGTYELRSRFAALSSAGMTESPVWLHESWLSGLAKNASAAVNTPAQDNLQTFNAQLAERQRGPVTLIQVKETRSHTTSPAVVDSFGITSSLQPEAQPSSTSKISAAGATALPESIRADFTGGATIRNAALRLSPALINALEPVRLSEELAEKLLLEKIPPVYPEPALRAGLQGSVTLQAWIAKDGTIRELKLIDGPFLLGEAAFRAVKQWRYQPYLQNGQVVEAQTLVTIDFRLPRTSDNLGAKSRLGSAN
ncbi:MAG: energy transducer TonB [Acidobacteriales bacterium]|nr:energy transducer TonB [Terriglobales bacterium]